MDQIDKLLVETKNSNKKDRPGRIRKYFKINVLLLPGKLSYFFGTGSKYTLMAFMVLFLTRSGLDPQEAGYIVGTRYTVEVVGAIFSNFLADRWGKRRFVMLASITISTIITFLMPWLADAVTENGFQSSGEFQQKSSKRKFNILLLLNTLAALFDGGICPAIDARVFRISKQISNVAYIRQRIWVSIGLGAIPFVTGALIDQHDDESGSKILFYVVLIVNICLMISCYYLFTLKHSNSLKIDISPSCITQTNRADIKGVYQREELMFALKSPDVIICLLCFLLIGLGFMFQYTFVFLLLQTELTASRMTMGFLALLQAFAEVITAPLGHAFEKYFQSSFVPMMFSLFGFAISFLFYFFVRNVVLMAFTSVLVGGSFSLFMYPAANLLYKSSTENCRGTLFAISSALLNGTGGCIAGFLGGYLFRTYGGRKSFMAISGVYFGLGFVLGLFTFVRMKYRVRGNIRIQSNI